ncbi:1,4-dihydroxy-2-naphthoate polyprenyltransferase [uncultured Friedmanniella sp.]|uniref:1,4-dihydroxy-2-naphthoate polyprenyltransferase n=1 Tax=uncultured Friedmanniella sp. TaxID=335381 RepID=UPI0035CC3367
MTAELAPHPTPGQWLAGSRPRTLPAAASPVIAATGLAVFADRFAPVAALLALVVALALQVGVNYANDYSDGIRGTDANRVGPVRLVGSGLARPAAVRRAAFGSFGLAGLAGLGLVLLTGHWWLIAVGVACVLAAWYYTGGRSPYGYRGLGEVSVFVFFGLVAVSGTAYVQVGRVSAATVLTGAWVGALACALLVANNLRDLRGDAATGKRTLATRLGDRNTRLFYAGLVAGAAALVVVVGLLTSVWALLGLAGLAVAVPACRRVLGGAVGPELVAVLKNTGTTELLAALGFALGLVLSRL